MNRRTLIGSGLATAACLLCSRGGLGALNKGNPAIPSSSSADLWKWSHEAYHYKVTERGVECANFPSFQGALIGAISTLNPPLCDFVMIRLMTPFPEIGG